MDESILYTEDDVDEFSKNLTNFPDMPVNLSTETSFHSFSSLYKKYYSFSKDKPHHSRYVYLFINYPKVLLQNQYFFSGIQMLSRSF